MLIDKTTSGFVIQTIDTETKKYTSQSFVAGDDVDYEVDGEPVDPQLTVIVEQDGVMVEPYLPFDMVQPQDMEPILAHADSIPIKEKPDYLPLQITQDFVMALATVVDLATENALDMNCDDDLKEMAQEQNYALEIMTKFLDKTREHKVPTAYEQVIKDFAIECEDEENGELSETLLEMGLDGLRRDVVNYKAEM